MCFNDRCNSNWLLGPYFLRKRIQRLRSGVHMKHWLYVLYNSRTHKWKKKSLNFWWNLQTNTRHDTVDCEVKKSITTQPCHFSRNIFREHHTAEWCFRKIHDIETQKLKHWLQCVLADCSVFFVAWISHSEVKVLLRILIHAKYFTKNICTKYSNWHGK